MNVHKIEALLNRLDQRYDWKLGVCGDPLREKVFALDIPGDLAYILTSHWPQTPGMAGVPGYGFDCTGQVLLGFNKDELLPQRLLQIGDLGNGDALVLDLRVEGYPVGVLSHEEFDFGQEHRENITPIAPSLEAFLLDATEDRLAFDH